MGRAWHVRMNRKKKACSEKTHPLHLTENRPLTHAKHTEHTPRSSLLIRSPKVKCLAVLRAYNPPTHGCRGKPRIRARSPSSPALAPRVPPWPGTKAPFRPPPPPQRRWPSRRVPVPPPLVYPPPACAAVSPPTGAGSSCAEPLPSASALGWPWPAPSALALCSAPPGPRSPARPSSWCSRPGPFLARTP